MIRVGFGGRAALTAIVVVGCASVAACGGDSGSSSQAVSTSTVAYPITRTAPNGSASAMQISGSPSTTATVGLAYSFEPTVSGTTGTSLKFTIANKPSWANFDTATGKLTGTPSAPQVGTYANITISLATGTTAAALPAFSIVVAEGHPANVTLSWQPPTENADGSALADLKGFKVHYGASSKTYSDTIQVANAGITTYVVQNLAAGKYYFAVTAYNAAGQESTLSPEVSTQVD